MPEPSDKQARAMTNLIKEHGVGEIVGWDGDSVKFSTPGGDYKIGPRGGQTELSEGVTKQSSLGGLPPTADGPGSASPDPSEISSGQDASGREELEPGPDSGLPDAGLKAPDQLISEGTDTGNGSEGLPMSPDMPDQNGADDRASSSAPTSSPDPSPADQDEAEGTTSAAEQATPDPALPAAESGVTVPLIESLPQADREEAYVAMSLADERQVVADLEGNALKSMVYGFPAGGKQVYGLSWVGARESVRQFNVRGKAKIRVSPDHAPIFEDVMINTEIGEIDGEPIYGDIPGISCTVYGEDAQHGGGQWGTATVARDQIKKWSGWGRNKTLNVDDQGFFGRTPDGFARAKALSKAQRNALEPQIPRWFVEQLIALFVGEGEVEYIEGTGREKVIERPPALTDERAKAQLDEIRRLYSEWGKLGGKKAMPPALFNKSIENAQHDHDRLEDFRKYLAGELEKAQGGEAGGN